MGKRVKRIEPSIWKIDDGKYQVDYYDPYGRRRYRHLDRLHDALQLQGEGAR
jgi:hypothetical protein